MHISQGAAALMRARPQIAANSTNCAHGSANPKNSRRPPDSQPPVPSVLPVPRGKIKEYLASRGARPPPALLRMWMPTPPGSSPLPPTGAPPRRQCTRKRPNMVHAEIIYARWDRCAGYGYMPERQRQTWTPKHKQRTTVRATNLPQWAHYASRTLCAAAAPARCSTVTSPWGAPRNMPPRLAKVSSTPAGRRRRPILLVLPEMQSQYL